MGPPTFVFCSEACGRAWRIERDQPAVPPIERDQAFRRASARWAVKYAIQRGILKRGPCEREGDDCSGPVEAHHDDYDRPLEVRWLCVGHHRKEDGHKHRAHRQYTERATDVQSLAQNSKVAAQTLHQSSSGNFNHNQQLGGERNVWAV